MFHGWRIVALAFLTNYVSVGFVFYSYGVFFKALAVDFGGSRLGVSIGLTAMTCVSALAAPFVGRLLDRGKTRVLMTLGALLMGLGFVVGSRVATLLELYAVLGFFMGLAVCMLGGISSATLVAHWFVAKRGTALGLAAMGVSVSGVIMPPLGTALIEHIGWRSTFLVYAAIAWLVLAPATFRFVIDRPEDVGQRPDGRPPARESAPDGETPVERPPRTAQILRDGRFWRIAAALALNFCCMSAVLTHAVPHVTDLGVPATRAALVLSAMAGLGAVGKPLFGALTDRMDKRLTLSMCTGLQMLGVWLLLQVSSLPALVIAGAVFGLGMGGVVPLQGALVGAVFGRVAFGRVMGLLSPAMLPVQMIGVPLAGYIHDRSGSYRAAFQLFLGLFALSLLAIGWLRLPELEPGRLHETPSLPPVA